MSGQVEDGSVRVVVSPTVNYAVILALLGSYGAGAWFLATQFATNVAMAERLSRFELAMSTRLEAGDKRDDLRAQGVEAIGTRLTRMEAQLAYLVTNGAKR